MPMFALNFVNLFDCKTFNCTHVSKKERINKKINKYINNNFEVVKNDFEVEHSHILVLPLPFMVELDFGNVGFL